MFSCKKWRSSTEEVVVAKTNGNYLYASDIALDNNLVFDSIAWKQEQIESWLKKQLWLKETNEISDAELIERKVQDYKESLLVEAQKDAFIEKAKLVVTDEMISAYYKEHQASFLLDEEMFNLRYFLKDNTEDINELINGLNKEELSESLQAYCLANPEKCLQEPSWVGKSLLQDFGVPEYLWIVSGKYQKYFLGDDQIFIFRIESKKKKGEVAPLEELKGDIKQILTFQLEKELIQKKEDELLINAKNKNSFEIY